MTRLREKDVAVLQAVREGASTVAEIGEVTTLSNREINYSLTEFSLEEQGLVRVDRQTGREWREIDGDERYVWKPKRVTLTDRGLEKLAELETKAASRYQEMSKRELVERIQELEERMDRMETVFKDFRRKVMKQI